MTRNRFSILLLWLGLLLTVALAGCGDSPQSPETNDQDTDDDPLDGAVLCLSDSTCALDGGCDTSATMAVTNCGNSIVLSWSVVADSTWVGLSVASGQTPGSFCIMADSNLSGAVRAATVTVTSSGLTDSTMTLTVSQLIPGTEPSQAELSVSVTAWDALPSGAVSPDITVTNIGDDVPFDWLVATDETWLTLSETGGTTPGSFTITAASNETGSSRSGAVTVSAEGVTGSPWEITVDQAFSSYIVGSIAILGELYSVFVSGDYAYVAASMSGLAIVDVSTPTSPAPAGGCDTPGDATGVFVSGNYAYVADWGSGLQIINISNPSNPSLVGNYDTEGLATNVFVLGNYAYIADGTNGLVIVNVSNPSSPSFVGSYNTASNAYDVYVIGDYAFVADEGDGLVVVNVSNPSTPSLAGGYDTPVSARGVYVVDNTAYIADYSGGLVILNVSTPSSPTLLGSHNTPGYASAVFVDGDYAYVADEHKGCQVIDVSNPSLPSPVTSEDAMAWDVFVSGDYVFVADYNGSLLILNFGLSAL